MEGTGNKNNSPQFRRKRGSQDLFLWTTWERREGKEEKRKVDGQETAQNETLSLGEIPVLKNKLVLSS